MCNWMSLKSATFIEMDSIFFWRRHRVTIGVEPRTPCRIRHFLMAATNIRSCRFLMDCQNPPPCPLFLRHQPRSASLKRGFDHVVFYAAAPVLRPIEATSRRESPGFGGRHGVGIPATSDRSVGLVGWSEIAQSIDSGERRASGCRWFDLPLRKWRRDGQATRSWFVVLDNLWRDRPRAKLARRGLPLQRR